MTNLHDHLARARVDHPNVERIQHLMRADRLARPAWIDRHLVVLVDLDLVLVLVLEAGPRGRDQVGHWPRD